MTTQAEFALSSPALSQSDKILAHLRLSRGQWVPMPDLVMVSGSFNIHSRISDLRKRGLQIDHKDERNERNPRQIKSFYRIVE